jgi:hemerythrin superfamily protein
MANSISVEILLSDDHEEIDGLYESYLAEKRSHPDRALAAFKIYKASLLRHIKCEEDLIFPVLAEAPNEPASEEVPILRDEHQIIVPLLMEVEKHLKQGTDSTFSERKLFEELHEHNAREEMRVYGPLDRLLDESQKQAVAEALKSMRLFPPSGA